MLSLPDELLDKILLFLPYDEISHLRLVCKRFDCSSQRLLNQGFLKVEKYHAMCLRGVKSQLPRRESERRKHPLARHCDILTAIETRLSLLGMTFMKYVEMDCCCFIPGKVIDEIYKVLRYVMKVSTPPRAHEILQELRDISSMAMEHFDEKISPALKQKLGSTVPKVSITPHGSFTYPGPSQSFNVSQSVRHMGLKQEYSKLLVYVRHVNTVNNGLKKDISNLKLKMFVQKRKIKEQEKTVDDQKKLIAEQTARLVEQDKKITEINRKMLEYDRYFADIMAEMSKLRDEKVAMSLQAGETMDEQSLCGKTWHLPEGVPSTSTKSEYCDSFSHQKRTRKWNSNLDPHAKRMKTDSNETPLI